MLLIDHILHKNHIFNNVRFWEDRHFKILVLKDYLLMPSEFELRSCQLDH
jgi:hypothetical protein